MKKPCIMGLALVLLSGTNLFAQEKKEEREILNEVIISTTKFEEKKENTTKIVYQITQEDIKKNQGSTVIDLLNRLPGVEIRGLNSNPSEPRGLFVRGGRGRQVLVLIDGVPVSDPSGINQEFDLRYLSLNQIERIEVLKGASSTLYGTGAATGVINIILKKAAKDSFRLNYETSIGTNNSTQRSTNRADVQNLNSSISFSEDSFSMLASVNLQSTSGQSSALDNTGTFDEDPFSTENFLLKLGYDITKDLKVTGFLNHDSFRFDYDNGGFSDSETNSGRQHQTRVGLNINYKYKGGELTGVFSQNNLRRTDNGFVQSVFEGTSTMADVTNKLNILEEELFLITGFNYQKHDNNTFSPFGNIERSIANFTTIDPYASLVYSNKNGLNANAGARLNMHSEYGNHLVYDVSLSQRLLRNNDKFDVKLISSYSTAFIAPSTYQLFSDFGNLALDPETSSTFEFGFTSEIGEDVSLNAAYFNRKENDAIIFASLNVAPFGQYQNATVDTSVDGIETELRYGFEDDFELYVNYTYTNKEQDLDYIPTHKWLASLQYSPSEKLNALLTYRNVGDRLARYFDSVTFTTVEETISSYSLVDISMNYSLLKNKVTLFGQVTNLLNEDFQDILGFTTRGRNYLLGLSLRL